MEECVKMKIVPSIPRQIARLILYLIFNSKYAIKRSPSCKDAGNDLERTR